MLQKHVKCVTAMLWAMAFCGLAASPVLFAQSTGRLTGTVQDPSGAVLPGTTVTLTPAQSEQAETAVANAKGEYEFRGVAASKYTLTVDAPSFIWGCTTRTELMK